MNEQKPLDEFIGSAIGGDMLEFDFDAWQQRHQQDIEQFKARMKSRTRQSPTGADVWTIITKSRITKLTAPAVVLVVFFIGLTYWLPSGDKQQTTTQEEKIQIPAQLAAMPLEQLLEIHSGTRQSSFPNELVRAATERALDRLSAPQIIALARRPGRPAEDANAATRTRTHIHMGTVAPPPAPPGPMLISGMVAAADLIVQARVDRVKLDADDATAAILEKRGKWVKVREVEEFVARIKGTVQLDVRVSYPASAAGEPLVVHADFYTTQRAGHIEQGKEYLVALKQEGETMSMLPNRGRIYMRQDGVYVVDSNSETASGSRYGSMPLDHTWQLIMDAYDAIHERVLPPHEILDYWLAKLQSDDLIDCWTAVEYFSTLVRYCWLAKLQSYEIVDCLTAVEYLNTLVQPPVDSEAVAEALERQVKMRAKYTTGHGWRPFHSELDRRSGFVKDAFDLLIKLGDPNTNERMVELYKRERVFDDSIFSEHAVGNYDTIVSRIRSLVPSRSPEAEKSLRAVLEVIKGHPAAEDNQFIPFLAEILARHPQVPRLIAERIPDPCLAPLLRQALENKYTGDLVWALYASGREQEAVEIAGDHVRDYLDNQNRAELAAGPHYSMWRTIWLLGISGSQAPTDLIEALTYDDAFSGPRANHLQAAAVMAFARAGADRAIERLRALYATDDYYVRIAAAVSLYYLGDDTGYDLLQHFINHTERTVPEIEKYWARDMWNLHTRWGKPFHEALLYLRSPQTEELFLQRLRNGVRRADMQALAIAQARKPQVLPILVEHLTSPNRVTRRDANEMLKRLTGRNFEFNPWKPVGRQSEA
ncbi:MAG: HEAT repeat domain-containing protein, partial [Planctomycetota bacterium]